jgi:hypothetical protein
MRRFSARMTSYDNRNLRRIPCEEDYVSHALQVSKHISVFS